MEVTTRWARGGQGGMVLHDLTESTPPNDAVHVKRQQMFPLFPCVVEGLQDSSLHVLYQELSSYPLYTKHPFALLHFGFYDLSPF